jgi:tripeptide aminopeptidase
VRVRVHGPGGHSWGDRGTPSAVHALVAACAAARAAAGDRHLNVGVIAGGTSINTIAAEASAELDLRDADGATLDATVERVAAAAREAAPDGVTIDIEALGRRPAGATPTDHPLVEAARAARAHAGLPPAEETASSTDANAAMGRDIPAICVGLTEGSGAHTTSERVELGPLAGGLFALETLVCDTLTSG